MFIDVWTCMYRKFRINIVNGVDWWILVYVIMCLMLYMMYRNFYYFQFVMCTCVWWCDESVFLSRSNWYLMLRWIWDKFMFLSSSNQWYDIRLRIATVVTSSNVHPNVSRPSLVEVTSATGEMPSERPSLLWALVAMGGWCQDVCHY
jgi:hypothetical protein